MMRGQVSARKARSLAKAYAKRFAGLLPSTRRVLASILDAASRGHSSYQWPFLDEHDRDTVKQLERLGYTVTIGGQSGPDTYNMTVTW